MYLLDSVLLTRHAIFHTKDGGERSSAQDGSREVVRVMDVSVRHCSRGLPGHVKHVHVYEIFSGERPALIEALDSFSCLGETVDESR